MDPIAPKTPRLVIFGAGRMGLAVAKVFADLAFRVEHYDSRPEAASADVAIFAEDDLVEMAALAGLEDFVVILTHSHDLDYRLVLAVLGAGQVRYCGLIGSRTKRDTFLARLAQDGLSAAEIGRLTCPIGIPSLKGKEPQVIAISVAAQLLELSQEDDVGR